jgi:hypothetical protein
VLLMILSNRIALAVALASGVCGVGVLVVACGSSSPGGGGNGTLTGDGSTANPDGGGANTEDGGESTVNNTTPGSCASATIPLLFSPMYSAFIPGSTAQTFQIPAITNDGNTAAWSSSDPTSVQLAPDSTTGGVMITVTAVPASGSITIFAAEGSACGSSALSITSNQETDWTTGNARYNDGVAIERPEAGGGHGPFDGGFPEGGFPEGGFGGFNPDAGSFFEEDGGTACVNCHGPVQIGNSGFTNVAHTPEQTGGFSDSELVDIIVNGAVPDGGYFDPTVLNTNCTDAGTTLLPGWVDGTGAPTCAVRAYARWQVIHRWADISTPALQQGIVCYLRSLTPVPQGGSSDFGGGGGGGFGDGGAHHHHDGGGGGGGGGGTDSGPPADASGD